ncbi:hypothetical protein HAP41_0000048965 (plasmid) [Bradyrhizobium barranii subsp. apii]|uniref:Uncharacterized protein n=1 Tax=Bradyrhizobium barranii subsp. apii TaxID=2819348 RepID=A0A8T5VJ82_9BRAD|nr:hypothetical protein [Bradyrhizobium barranii]UPT92193.1 hypothetical protein HAP41_0000048965 [Bradyrhizobium barranii subsp. apii]
MWNQHPEPTGSRWATPTSSEIQQNPGHPLVRRLMGYGRFDGVETARMMGDINFFQPSFKLKEKRREGAKVIKRYHLPSTP